MLGLGVGPDVEVAEVVLGDGVEDGADGDGGRLVQRPLGASSRHYYQRTRG